MSILGHGIDLVETDRIARMLSEHGDRFLTRCFTEAERAYAAANARRRIEHLAGRFAAKEATLKALGTGWSGGIAWTDVEIVRPDDAGTRTAPPGVQLHGRAAVVARGRGVARWWLSISHVHSHAIASVLAVSE